MRYVLKGYPKGTNKKSIKSINGNSGLNLFFDEKIIYLS